MELPYKDFIRTSSCGYQRCVYLKDPFEQRRS
jgi:hypothetical protein